MQGGQCAHRRNPIAERLGVSYWRWQSALPSQGIAQEAGAVVDIATGWRSTSARLVAELGGTSVDDSSWEEVRLTDPWREQLAAGYDGAVWYRRTLDFVFLPPSPLALLLGPSLHGSYQLLVDGVEVAEIGSPSRLLPFPQPRLIPIPDAAVQDGRVQLAIRFHRVGWLSEAAGLTAGPFQGTALLGPRAELGRRLELARLQAHEEDLVPFMLGLLAASLGIFHFLLFWRRPSERAYLWFGLGALAFGANTLLFTRWVSEPVDHLTLTHRLTEISGHGALVALLLFLWTALDRPVERWLRLYLISHGFLVLFLVAAPFYWIWTTDPVRVAWMVPALLAAPAVLVTAMRRGHPEAQLLLAGTPVLVVAALGELARLYGAPLPDWLPAAGFSAVLLAIALTLAGRSSRAHAQLIVLRRNLERRLEQRTRALTDLSREGERVHRAHGEFLANVSYELRTPLNSVIGFANVLLRRGQGLNERDRGFLARIGANGKRLLELVDDVLDLSRIEVDQMEVRREATHVDTVARAAVDSLESAAHAKALYLYASVSSRLNAVRVDAQQLEHVLRNLIANAIQFTTHGGAVVRIEAQGGNPLAVVVEDTGVGISADKLDRILELFQQGGSGLSNRDSGAWLGLTIARSLCQMMGCELSVTSQPGVGSQFRISLPFAPVRPSATHDATKGALQIHDKEKGRLVLIIDDEPDARLLLEEHVRSFGMRPVSAANGLEGLRLARDLMPDLVTLDLKMPGMDGWAVLSAFKADPKLRNLPVVVVSVIADEARGTFLGHVDLVSKPVDRDALEEAVRRNLSGSASRALVVDDDPDSRLLLTTLLEGTVEEVRTAEDGVQALEVLEDFEPSVILLDLVMPRMDGMTFLRALRASSHHSRTPVLVVTSKELTRAEMLVLDRTTSGIVRKARSADVRGSLRDRLAVFLDASASSN